MTRTVEPIIDKIQPIFPWRFCFSFKKYDANIALGIEIKKVQEKVGKQTQQTKLSQLKFAALSSSLKHIMFVEFNHFLGLKVKLSLIFIV